MNPNALFLVFLPKISLSTTMTGSFGLLICFPVVRIPDPFLLTLMFPLEQTILLRRKVVLLLQKVFDALVGFLSDFAIAHPRLVCSAVGVLGALALLFGVVSINVMIGG